jgi:hypothetical protein
MTYNHAFTIAFAVGNSQYEDWADCLTNEKELVIAGLEARIAELKSLSSEYPEALDGFDTYEE